MLILTSNSLCDKCTNNFLVINNKEISYIKCNCRVENVINDLNFNDPNIKNIKNKLQAIKEYGLRGLY